MLNESTSLMPWLPLDKDGGGFIPRKGQQAVADYIAENPDRKSLAAKLPGGYGKSVTIAMAYAVMRARGDADRLLIVVSNDTQLNQAYDDFHGDCMEIGLSITGVWKFTNEPNTAIANRRNRAEVFVTNIQTVSSTARNAIDTLSCLLSDDGHKWMLAADEYHHYAEEKDWGVSLQRLVNLCGFTLATSATPDRDGSPTIFGRPAVTVSYEDGVNEGVLKYMKVRSFHYLADLLTPDGDIIRISTEDIRNGASSVCEEINIYAARTQMRFSSKYISPLLRLPIIRLDADRTRTNKRLQMLVRAVTCKHAASLVEQIRSASGDSLVVDWVGTGPDGRTDDENRTIKKRFCPDKIEKTINGKVMRVRAEPSLDVLVSVAMAGEGFDSVMVTEIVDLSLATLKGSSNMTRQFWLRGARWIHGLEVEDQILNINLPTDHPGTNPEVSDNVMAWIDSAAPLPEVPGPVEGGSDVPVDLPPIDVQGIIDGLRKLIDDIIFSGVDLNVSVDTPRVKALARNANNAGVRINGEMLDLQKQEHSDQVLAWYRAAARVDAQQKNEQLQMEEYRKAVDKTMRRVVMIGLTAKYGQSAAVPKSVSSDAFKQCNAALKQTFGTRDRLMLEELTPILGKLRNWENEILQLRFPSWL